MMPSFRRPCTRRLVERRVRLLEQARAFERSVACEPASRELADLERPQHSSRADQTAPSRRKRHKRAEEAKSEEPAAKPEERAAKNPEESVCAVCYEDGLLLQCGHALCASCASRWGQECVEVRDTAQAAPCTHNPQF